MLANARPPEGPEELYRQLIARIKQGTSLPDSPIAQPKLEPELVPPLEPVSEPLPVVHGASGEGSPPVHVDKEFVSPKKRNFFLEVLLWSILLGIPAVIWISPPLYRFVKFLVKLFS
jgi:hypothetical protein